MTTIYDKYATPSVIRLTTVSSGKITGGMSNVTVVHYGESLTLNPVWSSTYVGAQVQYRTRQRKAYSSGLSDDPSGAEVWTEYADWASPGTTATSNSEVTWYDATAKKTLKFRCATGISISASYSFSTYDCTEVQVRVRVYSTQYDRASEWAYQTLRIVYQPRLSSVSASTNAYGGVDFSFTTNWARPCELRLKGGLDERSGSIVSTWQNAVVVASGTTGTVPLEDLVAGRNTIKGSIWVSDARIVTPDYAGLRGDGGCSSIAYSAGGFKITPSAHTNPSDVPNPSISVTSSSGEKAVVAITCNCPKVVARGSWTDSDGNVFDDFLTVGGSAPNWTATLPAPPFGTEVTISAACCNSSMQYKLATATFTLASDVHCHLDGEGDSITLTYEGEFSQDSQLSGESIATAGRKLPVSRYGINVSRSIRVKGTIMFPSVFGSGDLELADLNVLDNPHDWVYRNPRGIRKHVRVTSWSVSQDTSQLGRLAVVTIDMEEVA